MANEERKGKIKFTARQILIYLTVKYKADWKKVAKAFLEKGELDEYDMAETLEREDETQWVTMADLDFPTIYLQSPGLKYPIFAIKIPNTFVRKEKKYNN